MKKIPRFEIINATVEHITLAGLLNRDRTVQVKLGKRSISKRALILGSILIICHILDGLLTYVGLDRLGLESEGNMLLRELIMEHGSATVLFIAKSIAVIFSLALMLSSHRRRWIRPVVAALVVLYLIVAIFPWFYILSDLHAKGVKL